MAGLTTSQLIGAVVERLRERLPDDWILSFRADAPAVESKRDGFLTIAAPGAPPAVIPVMAKARSIAPADVRMLSGSVPPAPPAGWLLVTQYLSPRAREEVMLSRQFAGAADPTGNVVLRLASPPMVIDLGGATSDPDPDRRPLRSLKGPAAARVVRALVDFRPPFTVSQVARNARASVPTASRVIRFLEREALVTTTRRQSADVEIVDWERCLRRWATDYSFFRSNRVAQFVAPRGFGDLLMRLDGERWFYAATGAIAANEYVSSSPPRLFSAFVSVPRDAVGGLRQVGEELGLAYVDVGGNVALSDPFDEVVYQRSSRRGDVTCVAASQAVVDLLTGPGREPQDAEALLAWMRTNESWRA